MLRLRWRLSAVTTGVRHAISAPLWSGMMALAASTLGCNSGDAPASTAPDAGGFTVVAAKARSDVAAFGPPTQPLPLPELDAAWTPPMLTTGDFEALAQTLRRYPTLGLVLEPGLRGIASEKRVHDLIMAINPAAKLVIRGETTLDLIMKERGEKPISRRVVHDGGRDLFGHPTYVLEDVQLKTNWLEREGKLAGADAFVILATAGASTQQEELYQVGSCEPMLDQLAAAKRDTAGFFGGFQTDANARLAGHYAETLAANWSALQAGLEQYAAPRTRGDFASERLWQTHECGASSRAWVNLFEPCLTTQNGNGCEFAPQLVLAPEVGVGNREPASFVAARCADLLDVDYVAQMRRIADLAGQSVAAQLDLAWAELAARRAVLTQIETELARVCQPKARRITQAAARDGQMRVQSLGKMLAQAPPQAPTGAWQHAGFTGTSEAGGVYLSLRYAANEQSTARRAQAELAELTQFLTQIGRCESQVHGDRLYLVIADVHDGTAAYYGRFFANDLFCLE